MRLRLQVGVCGLLAAAAAWSQTQEPAPGEPPARRWTTLERLSAERLAAAHADVERLRAAVEPPPALPGLNDYRGVFHAHAGDSNHTGGTPEELLRDAGRVDVDVVFLSDHYRPPRDFMDGWRGLRDGVLFIPGSEAHGFLIHPEQSVVEHMSADAGTLLRQVNRGAGMAFLSHVEERLDHPMDGLTGTEIYNRHADALDDGDSMRALVSWIVDPDQSKALARAVELYPEEVFGAQFDYPALYLDKWDRETVRRRIVGVNANDCHHNQVFVVIKVDDDSVRVGTIVDDPDEMRVLTTADAPRIPELVRGHEPGDLIGRYDLDPYWVSMRNSTTHILAPALDEASIRAAVAAGHVYVAHDWLADPTGFSFYVTEGEGPTALMGEEWTLQAGKPAELTALFPLPATIRLIRNGEEIAVTEARSLTHTLDQPGVYRVEGWLEVDGEWRTWIYSNPVYVK
ncbi:MAG: histidinol phosphatase [Holophagales bacterium]|nr:histidinol phosphatase [Holophagales bacterium]